jgi:hypothetical protein
MKWRKSTESGPWTDNCVEVAHEEGDVLVRDSRGEASPILRFTPAEWRAFIGTSDGGGCKGGEFDI